MIELRNFKILNIILTDFTVNLSFWVMNEGVFI